jgi:hypothetical protein
MKAMKETEIIVVSVIMVLVWVFFIILSIAMIGIWFYAWYLLLKYFKALKTWEILMILLLQIFFAPLGSIIVIIYVKSIVEPDVPNRLREKQVKQVNNGYMYQMNQM